MNASYRRRNGPAAFQHGSSAFHASPQVGGNGDAGPFSPRRGRIFPVFAPVQVTLSDRSHRQSSVLSSDLILFCCCEKVLRAARCAENTSRRQLGKSRYIRHGGRRRRPLRGDSSSFRKDQADAHVYSYWSLIKKKKSLTGLNESFHALRQKQKIFQIWNQELDFLLKKQLQRWQNHAKRFFYLRTSTWSVFIKLCPVKGQRRRERFLFPETALAVAWKQHLRRRNPEPCDWTGPFHWQPTAGWGEMKCDT